MKKAFFILLFMGVVGFGISCSSTTGTASTSDSLTSTAWRLSKFNGKVIDSTTFARTPELRFWVGSKVSGNDGCNLVTGSYTVQGDKIMFGAMAGTKMACVNTNYENYNKFFNRTNKYKVESNKLVFYEGTTELMSYTKK
ncbi:META domain-containing protein [Flavobacterium sp.]|uniref:META domain-containing protein n=1 Tax=Flavobacterium sp. TaxID=239 RepID=UPI0028BDA6AF|nr:META domain-containing protein [Flavobacterium sp.]